jgi:serine/threonine protein kinase
MAPEYAMEGIFSIKSDVYSFGVLVLEVVTGTRRSSLNHTMGFPNLIAYVSICLLTSCKLKSLSSHYKPIRITTIKMVLWWFQAWTMWTEGNTKDLADSSIIDSCLLDEVLLCSHIALLCVQENPHDRPVMSSVVYALDNGSTTLPTPNWPTYFGRGSNEIDQLKDDI